MQVIPSISNTEGYPLLAIPFSFIVFVQMVKDFNINLKRYLADEKENN